MSELQPGLEMDEAIAEACGLTIADARDTPIPEWDNFDLVRMYGDFDAPASRLLMGRRDESSTPSTDIAQAIEAIAEACGLTITSDGNASLTHSRRRAQRTAYDLQWFRVGPKMVDRLRWNHGKYSDARRFTPSTDIAQAIKLAERFDSWELMKHSAELFRFSRWASAKADRDKFGVRKESLAATPAAAIGLGLIAAGLTVRGGVA